MIRCRTFVVRFLEHGFTMVESNNTMVSCDMGTLLPIFHCELIYIIVSNVLLFLLSVFLADRRHKRSRRIRQTTTEKRTMTTKEHRFLQRSKQIQIWLSRHIRLIKIYFLRSVFLFWTQAMAKTFNNQTQSLGVPLMISLGRLSGKRMTVWLLIWCNLHRQ
jgi:hypothetical protein